MICHLGSSNIRHDRRNRLRRLRLDARMDGWMGSVDTSRRPDRRDDDDDDASERDDDASDDADDEPRTPRGGDDDDDARGGDVRSAFAVHEGDALRRRGLGEGGRGGDGDERGHRAHRNGAKKTDERYVSHRGRWTTPGSGAFVSARRARARADDGAEGLGRAGRPPLGSDAPLPPSFRAHPERLTDAFSLVFLYHR